MPLIKFKFIHKGLIFFHQVVYPSCLPTHQRCVQKSWCLQVHVKIPNTCNNVCQALSSTCSAEHTLVFQYIPSLDGSLSLIWVSACFRSSFLKFSMPFICCSIFFSIWIAAITRAFTLQYLVFLYSWILIFWLDV